MQVKKYFDSPPLPHPPILVFYSVVLSSGKFILYNMGDMNNVSYVSIEH
jgi:hypothetical protein